MYSATHTYSKTSLPSSWFFAFSKRSYSAHRINTCRFQTWSAWRNGCSDDHFVYWFQNPLVSPSCVFKWTFFSILCCFERQKSRKYCSKSFLTFLLLVSLSLAAYPSYLLQSVSQATRSYLAIRSLVTSSLSSVVFKLCYNWLFLSAILLVLSRGLFLSGFLVYS